MHQPQPGDIFEIGNVQRPKLCIIPDCASGDGEIRFAIPWTSDSSIKSPCNSGFLAAEGNRRRPRKQPFLNLKILLRARTTKPLIEGDGGKQDSLAAIESP